MPLADAGRVVTLLLEDARDRGLPDRRAQLAALLQPLGFVIAAHVPDAQGAFHASDALLIAAGHQRGAGRGAFRRIGVALPKAHALAADGIDVGRADVGTAVTGEVSVAQVVGKEQDYVRAARSRCQRGDERGSARAAQKSPSV